MVVFLPEAELGKQTLAARLVVQPAVRDEAIVQGRKLPRPLRQLLVCSAGLKSSLQFREPLFHPA